MEGILFKANVKKVSTLVDGSLTVSLDTPEMSNEEAAKLLSLRKIQGLVYISPKQKIDGAIMDSIDGSDIEPDQAGKSPSQRLRAVLYVAWKQNNEGYKDPELYYRYHVERFIDQVKEKLDPA